MPRAEAGAWQRRGAVAGAVSGVPLTVAADRSLACAYAPRCAWAGERCLVETPRLRPVRAARVACHHAEQVIGG